MAAKSGARTREDFDLSNHNPGDGGFFENSVGNVTLGAGLRIYLLSRVALRAEFRALMFRDEFDFDQDPDTEPDGYTSMYTFAQLGLAFKLF